MDFGDNAGMKLAAYWQVLQTDKERTRGNKRIRKHSRVAALINIDVRGTNEKRRYGESVARRKVI